MHLVIVRLRGFRPPCCSPHEPWTVEAFRGTQKAKRVMLAQQTQLTPLRSVRKVAVHSVVKISWCLCRFLRHPSIPYLQVHPRHAHVSPRSLPSPLCPSRCLTRPHAYRSTRLALAPATRLGCSHCAARCPHPAHHLHAPGGCTIQRWAPISEATLVVHRKMRRVAVRRHTK